MRGHNEEPFFFEPCENLLIGLASHIHDRSPNGYRLRLGGSKLIYNGISKSLIRRPGKFGEPADLKGCPHQIVLTQSEEAKTADVRLPDITEFSRDILGLDLEPENLAGKNHASSLYSTPGRSIVSPIVTRGRAEEKGSQDEQ